VAKITLREEDSGPLLGDARFWRQVYPEVRRLSENGFSIDGNTPATVALAQYWKKTRQVGALPAKLDEPVSTNPEEAAFIIAFCENHRRARWRRSTTLSALRFETYRQKSGTLPPQWKHSIPDGATLELIHQPATVVLQLTDTRSQHAPAVPAWLGTGSKSPEAIHHTCPLHGGR
jgi:hypothetical protein